MIIVIAKQVTQSKLDVLYVDDKMVEIMMTLGSVVYMPSECRQLTVIMLYQPFVPAGIVCNHLHSFSQNLLTKHMP